jgi:hypothetical protein
MALMLSTSRKCLKSPEANGKQKVIMAISVKKPV